MNARKRLGLFIGLAVGPLKKAAARMAAAVVAKPIDFSLVGISLVCFSIFASGTLDQERRTGIDAPIATVVRGPVERKQNGSKTFLQVQKGEKFFNMDAAWTGPGQEAELLLDDGSKLQMAERSLIVLKRPFRRREHALREKVSVISGRVKVFQASLFKSEKYEEFQRPASWAPERKTEESQKIYPPENGILYFRETGELTLRFAWSKPLSILKPEGSFFS